MDVPQYPSGQQLPGTVYRVVRHLATGGMGSVYDVEDVTVGKRYVLKTLHPQLVSRQDLAKRMEAEARALAKLQHPNIVDVVTAGVTTDDKRMPFYVMERLNGQNLRVVIEKKGSLELPHCYRIAIDVLDALEHAHENSVIHRDVKPENIFLHRNVNGTTTTKLLDFGIMRLLDRKASHTQGKFIGTLRYASPEQIFGGDLGPATDIYSLGIVLYEMLSGRGPFDDVGDAYAIGAAHAQRPPPPLSQFVHLPVGLERLVMKSLAKAPHERPRDCFSFAAELRRMLRDEEAAPRSATAVNVLSAAPATRAAEALAGTELSSDPHVRAATATEVGMIAPSEPVLAALRPAAGMPIGPAAPAGGPTALGDAATLASEPGVPPVRVDRGSGRAPPLVDREAETRASAGAGNTQPLAPNGTEIDDGLVPLLPDDAVRAALAQREPLELPPTSGNAPYDVRGHELVFPVAAPYVTGTGPLAGEARTRPPGTRAMLLPLVAAALGGAALVGGLVLVVLKPWVRPSAAPSSVAATDAPGASALPIPGAAGNTPSSAAPAAASAVAPPAANSATVAATLTPTATATHTVAASPTAAAEPPPKASARGKTPPIPAPAASAPRKPTRPAPRPEDIGFE